MCRISGGFACSYLWICSSLLEENRQRRRLWFQLIRRGERKHIAMGRSQYLHHISVNERFVLRVYCFARNNHWKKVVWKRFTIDLSNLSSVHAVISFNNFSASLWHRMNELSSVLDIDTILSQSNGLSTTLHVVNIAKIFVNFSYQVAPDILYRVKVSAKRRPFECFDNTVSKELCGVFRRFCARIVLLKTLFLRMFVFCE